MFDFTWVLLGAAIIVVLLVAIGIPMAFRRVVPANETHIVRTGNQMVSYGNDKEAGNVYYAWPSWVPKLGVVVAKLPLSVFSVDLMNYDGYDKGRLPFLLDIKAFFRIVDSNTASIRVANFGELRSQLEAILQGAVRTILAAEDIETILSGRAEFGERFTAEVDGQLKNWGVATVKMIELMDIRDTPTSTVIANIMEKKKSLIERESRVEVAENMRAAELAEIEAEREIELGRQQAQQQVGIRTAEAEREVGIAKEVSNQAIQEQRAVTTAKVAEVKRVEEVKSAEIQRDRALVAAEEQARTTVIKAEGDLRSTQLGAEGVKAAGQAEAEAAKLMQLAPVEAQITLAREIGENQGYQTYLVTLEQVKASQAVGIAQAEALGKAQIKVVATGGTVEQGISSIGQLMSANGGAKVGAMLEGLANTDEGTKLLGALGTLMTKSSSQE